MENLKRAVIVAAGRSSRLYPLTLKRPKGLLSLGDNSGPIEREKTLLGNSVQALLDRGIEEIAIVVGYLHEEMRKTFTDPRIQFISNPFFEQMNNLGSLWMARHWVLSKPEGFVYLHSDLAFEPRLLDDITKVLPGQALLLTDFGPTDEEAMKVRATSDQFLIESSKEVPPAESAGEWVGIAAFSGEITARMISGLETVLWEKEFQAYDTRAFSALARDGMKFKLLPTAGRKWIEIDTAQDLERARKILEVRT